MIRVKGLHKSFGGNHVLRGVDLEIRQGELIVILGKSGSGKTVLLKHLTGLLKPDEGEVIIDDINISVMEGPSLYKSLMNIAIVFQGGALFDSMTVGENVAFFLMEHLLLAGKKIQKSDIKKLVTEALEKVGLKGIEHLHPGELSGGMKKRVAFARGVVYAPEFIFFDEPTTGLDPLTSMLIAQLMVDLHELYKNTSVVISHDIVTTLFVADRIALLEEGVIAVIDTPENFMKTDHPAIHTLRRMIGGDLELIRKR